MNSTALEIVDHPLYLGIYLHYKLSWQPKVDYICGKFKNLGFLWRNMRGSSRTCEKSAMTAFCATYLGLLLCYMGSTPSEGYNKLEMVQHKPLRQYYSHA